MTSEAGLTGRQLQILRFIQQKIAERGYPPSVREIGEALGLRSSSTVHAHISRLVEKGYLRRDPTKPRALEIVHPDFLPGVSAANRELVELPVVGQVTAGAPILAVENIEDVISFPRSLVGGEQCFLLRVKGDSMIEAGILDGDYVIVRKQDTASNGDIVVALIDDEATVKRFFRENNRIRLQPENRHLEPIYTRDVTIVGKVIGVYRKLI